MYEQTEIIRIQISKLGWKYQIIDKTFSIKTPPVFSDELNITKDISKELEIVIEYIKSKYQNNKLDIEFNCISDLEKRLIEKELNSMLIKKET